MTTKIRKSDCPCCKGEYCTNGLRCTDQNCFLLKGSTFVTRSMEMPIEAYSYLDQFWPPTTGRASHYVHLNIRGLDDLHTQ